ncbi:MAG: hypothetical protein RAO94_09255 [Candidatus Stygibacter australis]|nr:hypothetical protein [Candidatus Stygibacter australis]MDP8322524.1 hypothetical protein [Candidatus Stygibacter australis]
MIGFFETLGVWIGALMTFAIFSFLYKDNPFYKVAEQIFVGLSAGYWFVYTIYNIVLPNLIIPLKTDFSANFLLIVPGILGIFMLLRIIPKTEWLSRFPMALMIGSSAGLGMLTYTKSDIIKQLTATMMNPFDGGDWVLILGQTLLILGTITGVIYFFFSARHKGFVGVLSRIGIYFLMVSFGGAFGYTAMARISLLIGRLQFLLGDWLGLIHP